MAEKNSESRKYSIKTKTMNQEQKTFLKTSCIFGIGGWTILGIIFPVIGMYLSSFDGIIFRIFERVFLFPLTCIHFLAQPIFELESEAAFYIYAIVSIVFWLFFGVLAVYLFSKYKIYKQHKKSPDIFSDNNRARSRMYISVVLISLVGFFVYAGILYSQIIASYKYRDEINRKRSEQETIIRQKNLEKKLVEYEKEKQKIEVIAGNNDDQSYFDARNEANSKVWKIDGKWKRYTNKTYDFAFDLPSNWSTSEFETNKDYIEIKIVNENLPIDIRNDFSIWLVATKKNYIPDGPTNGSGSCAVDFDDLDSFCQKGCRRLNKQTAIDYRIIYAGDLLPVAQAYSTASSTHSAICLVIDIYDQINKIAQKEGVSDEEVMKKYDLKSAKIDSDVPEELLEVKNVFERIAGSISKS